MKLVIHAGTWHIQSLDGAVRVVVYPRRAVEAEATRVVLRAEPMPALDIAPEKLLPGEAVEGWVWDGSPAGARGIIPLVMASIRKRLKAAANSTPRVRQWQNQVQSSLFPAPAALDGGRAGGTNAAS